MRKPVLLVVMDGVGFSTTGVGDAVAGGIPRHRLFIEKLPEHKTEGARHGRRAAVGRGYGQQRGRAQRARLRPDLF